MHVESMEAMRDILKKSVYGNGLKVLDVGSQDVQKGKQGTYRDLMRPGWEYTGCDIADGLNVDVVMKDPYKVPFKDGDFDVVLCGNCIEHVEYPAKLVGEMARVLKHNGMLILGAPFNMKEHRFPYDCWRFLPDGMRVLLRDAGLRAVSVWKNEIDCWGIGIKESRDALDSG